MGTPKTVSSHDILQRFLDRKEPRKPARFADGSELASIILGGRKFIAFTPPNDIPTLAEEGNLGALEKVMSLQRLAACANDMSWEPKMLEMSDGVFVPEDIVNGRF